MDGVALPMRRCSNSQSFSRTDLKTKFEVNDFDEIDEEAVVADGEGLRIKATKSSTSTSSSFDDEE